MILLAVIAESLNDLRHQYAALEKSMEEKGMRINTKRQKWWLPRGSPKPNLENSLVGFAVKELVAIQYIALQVILASLTL